MGGVTIVLQTALSVVLAEGTETASCQVSCRPNEFFYPHGRLVIVTIGATVSGSAPFSNFFKFATAALLLAVMAMFDFSDAWQAVVTSSGLWTNNLDDPKYDRLPQKSKKKIDCCALSLTCLHFHFSHTRPHTRGDRYYKPVMDISPVIRRHPWMFIYFAGFIRAFGFVCIVFASNICGYTVSMVLFLSSMLTFGLFMDHFGWFGNPIRLFNWFKIIGVGFLIGGALYINIHLYSPHGYDSLGIFILACLGAFFAGWSYIFSAALNRVSAVIINSYMVATFYTLGVGSLFLALWWGVATAVKGETTTYAALTSSTYWYGSSHILS